MKKLPFAGALLIVLYTLSACGSQGGSGASDSDGPIKVGVPLPLSGAYAFPGQGEQVGLKLAEAEINAHGGINGRQIQFDFVDDQSTPDGAVAAATRLVDQDKVAAVLNGSASDGVIATLPFYKGSGIVDYSISAQDPAVTNPFAKNVFKGATLNNDDAAPLYADYLKKVGTKKLAILEGVYPLYTSLMGPFKKQLSDAGIQVVDTETYNVGDTNYSAQISHIANSGADTVFVMAQLSDALTILPQLKQAGIKARLVGDTASADPTLLSIGSSAEGFTTFSMGGPQLVSDKTGQMGRFYAALAKYKISLPAKTPNVFSVYSYSDAYVLAEALRDIKGPITSDALIESLDANIQGFQAGPGSAFPYAAKIGQPRAFTADDHVGTKNATPVTVKNGELVPAS